MTDIVIAEAPLFVFLAAMSFFGASILRTRWQKRIAVGCGILEIAAITALLVLDIWTQP